MGTTLNGTQINNTYPGLLKTADNVALGATEKVMGDGLGNDSTLSLGTASASFTGTLDLAGATVTGLPGGAPGLVAGTGTDSMKSADDLVTNNATAAGARSIAIGDGANSNSDGSISIGSVSNVPPAPRPNYIAIGMDTLIAQNSIAMGTQANAQSDRGLAVGEQTQVFSDFGMAIGYQASVTSYQNQQIAIGREATSDSAGNIAIGWEASALGGGGFTRSNIAMGYRAAASNERTIALGFQATASGARSVAMSESALANGNRSIAIGQSSQSTGFNSVVVGAYSRATAEGAFAVGGYNAWATALYAGALGRETTSALAGGVAIGYQVTSVWEYGTTVNQLALQNYAAINYADDTAAATGGVPLGGVYHNAGDLRVRIA